MSAMSATLIPIHTQPLVAGDWRVAQLVDAIWRDHFADIPRANQIVAGYDYPWKWRLGRIRMTLDGRSSEIALNGLLDSADVSDTIRIAIISHEIVHYLQGFGSPLPRRHQHAHAHGCVSHELARRGLGAHERALDEWAVAIWPAFREQARRRQSARHIVWPSCATVAKMVY
jgi:hypothetical protein